MRRAARRADTRARRDAWEYGSLYQQWTYHGVPRLSRVKWRAFPPVLVRPDALRNPGRLPPATPGPIMMTEGSGRCCCAASDPGPSGFLGLPVARAALETPDGSSA